VAPWGSSPNQQNGTLLWACNGGGGRVAADCDCGLQVPGVSTSTSYRVPLTYSQAKSDLARW
jgi:hypothetical protein